MERQLEVVFRGQVADGASVDAVKQRLAELYRTDLAGIERLFSGREIILKCGLTPERAEKLRSALEQAQAVCEVREVAAKPTAEAVAARTEPSPAPRPTQPSRSEGTGRSSTGRARPMTPAVDPSRRPWRPSLSLVLVVGAVVVMGVSIFLMQRHQAQEERRQALEELRHYAGRTIEVGSAVQLESTVTWMEAYIDAAKSFLDMEDEAQTRSEVIAGVLAKLTELSDLLHELWEQSKRRELASPYASNRPRDVDSYMKFAEWQRSTDEMARMLGGSADLDGAFRIERELYGHDIDVELERLRARFPYSIFDLDLMEE